MDMDIISETKQKFSIAWKDHFTSRELPSLDFLNDTDQAYGQFRHSIAVINDCLASIKVEVFIVKFLRSHILSEGKCTSDLKLGFNVTEINADLESIFLAKTQEDGSGTNANGENRPVGKCEANSGESIKEKENSLLDKTSSRDASVKRDLYKKSSDIGSTNSIESENKQSINEEGDSLDKTQNKPEVEKKLSSSSTNEHPSSDIARQSLRKDQITIFTPIPDEHIESKSNETKKESNASPNLSPVEGTSIKLDKPELDSSAEKQSYNMVHVEAPRNGKEDDLQSSGNELEAFTDDPFSSDSCSNSPDPVHESVFLQDGVNDSDEIIKIMPFSPRSTSFYSVDPALKKPHFGTAEHIYEDIEKYRTTTDEEYQSETRRHLSQSEVTLTKTFSVGAINKPKNSTDDVFLPKDAKGELFIFQLYFSTFNCSFESCITNLFGRLTVHFIWHNEVL